VAAVLAIAIAFFATEAFFLSPDVRLGVIRLLGPLGADGALTRLLDDPDTDVRGAASDALVRRGEPAVRPLIRRIDDPDASGRTGAAITLGRLGTEARSAVPVLKRWMCEDPDPIAREQFAKSLGRVMVADPEQIAELVRLLETGNELERVGAAEALGATVEGAAAAAPALGRALADASPNVRGEAAEALGHAGPAARSALPALIAAVDDPDAGVRNEVREALQHLAAGLGPGDAELAQRIAEALRRQAPPGPARP
jgi:HEAT repeat protein